ncbi:MAG TPA: glycine cleavage system aminomethyltransferase GcvT [Clostridia bacterium]|nr:MAG: Aminomethyltransferase [Firmicutes bacterium ADurb.Bin146]HOD92675.1 glycine cleavage system aminomethyltransferase GcvT [Clostridia bacterium]HQM39821.1 glycine cleavage system aminomethyltransferase GcvT [Clostridia bacterium]
MKTTPLTSVHESLKARMVDFGGFYMPVQYTSIIEEHNAVRNHAGIFDVSHMGEIAVRGKDAIRYLYNLLTNDISIIANNQIMYSPMCYEHGGCVDDLLIYKNNDEDYLIIANASNTDKDYEWMLNNSKGYDVEISNESDKYGQIALQGPQAQSLLQQLTDTDLNEISFYRFKDNILINGITAMVSRTGYTGEDGFEIYLKTEDTEKMFKKLMELGALPCGLGARDTLRFESALPLYGHELSDKITPLNAGLKNFVKLEKNGFIGQKALIEQDEKGVEVRSAGLEMIDKGIARNGYEVFNEKDEKIGYVTSGSTCPSLNKNCALALISTDYTKVGTFVYVDIRGRKVKAVTVKKPFYNKKYKR